jgi:hypothetical protein
VVEQLGALLEQAALVDRFALAVAAELQQLLDGRCAEDQFVDLGELAKRKPPESFVGGPAIPAPRSSPSRAS